MPNPLSADRYPGTKTTRLAAYTSAGTSPQAGTVTLPEYGVYLAVVEGRFTNGNNTAVQVGIITWWKFDAAGGSANTVARTDMIGTPAYSAGPGSPTINSLTVSDPTTAGVVTVTVGWSDAATSRTAHTVVRLRRVFDTADFAATP